MTFKNNFAKIIVQYKNSPAKMKGYIYRELEEKIKKYLKLPQIIAILGPRRSGKTTLLLNLKEKLKKSNYLTFEDQKILDLFDKDIESFCKIHLQPFDYLIIDEFHYSKSGGKNLKYIFDLYKNKKVIISGSSVIDITIKVSKYLVGRLLSFNLLPFSFSEFLRAKDEKILEIYHELKEKVSKEREIKISQPLLEKFNRFLEEYLIFGGYPEVVLAEDKEVKITLLNNIYNLYFLKEVRDILGLIDDYKLKLLIKSLALQIGNLIQYQELANLSNFNILSVKKYLNFLEKTFISFPVRPFFTNKRVELSKNPKIYFFDTGFRNTVIDNFASFSNRQDIGVLLENFFVIYLTNKGKKFNFWRTKAKAEVDFVIEENDKLIPIEIKTTLTKPKITPSLLSFIKKYYPPRAYILSLNYFNKVKLNKTKVIFLPIFLSLP